MVSAITSSTTVDVALLLLVGSQAAQWARVFVEIKKASRANGKAAAPPTPANGKCPTAMQVDHIRQLSEHGAEIDGVQKSLTKLHDENRQDHKEILAEIRRG